MIKENVLNSFTRKNVLVTGDTGLIGRQIVNVLCDADAHVKIVSSDKININAKAEHIYGDLTNFEFCKNVTKEFILILKIVCITDLLLIRAMRGST